MDTNIIDVLTTEFAKVTHNPVLKLGKIEWLGKANLVEYQSAFKALLEEQRKNPIHYYLTDIRKQSVVSPENRKWFESVAIPKAIEQGLKKAAVVMDGNVFKKYYINVILNTTKKYGLPLKVFAAEKDAIEWLMQ